jgi:hypothetical protein
MAASHPHLFQSPVVDESEIRKLIANHFPSDYAVLQWRPATGEDILTPNMTEIVDRGRYSHTQYDRDCGVLFLLPTWIWPPYLRLSPRTP